MHASLAPVGSLFTLILLGHKGRKESILNCAVRSSQYSVFEQNLATS